MDRVACFSPQSYYELFPTIDHSLLINDGYKEEDSYLDIDYQEADYGNDLDLAAPNCQKNAKHNDFVDVIHFGLEHLPQQVRHPAVVVWLKYAAQLVVRLNNKANASGRVFIIRDHVDKIFRCKAEDCCGRSYRDEHNVYGGLGIITNTHVVKNNDEAKQTRVEFFYHDSDFKKRDLVTREYGHLLHTTNHNFDHTMFTCNMHDKGLVERIDICTNVSSISWRQIPEDVRKKLKDFAIVISHPHGTPKKISIGKVLGSEIRSDSWDSMANCKLLLALYEQCERNRAQQRFVEYFRLVQDISLAVRVTYYDAATCPGSSGAPVYMGNVMVENGLEVRPHTHRGKHPVNGYNNCYT